MTALPKKPFLRYHGNYCGPGNRGGAPIDDLDRACQKHDIGYHHTTKRRDRVQHDRSFVHAADSIARDKTKNLHQRVKAKAASLFFKARNVLHAEETMAEEKKKPPFKTPAKKAPDAAKKKQGDDTKANAKKKADIVKTVRKDAQQKQDNAFPPQQQQAAPDTPPNDQGAPQNKTQTQTYGSFDDKPASGCDSGKGKKDYINTDPEMTSTISTPMSYV